MARLIRTGWLTLWLVCLALWTASPLPSRAQSQRGQGARPPQAAGAGRYYALLIAVRNYRRPSVTTLDYPVADAQRVRQVLTADYNFDPQDVTLLRDPYRDAILGALEQLAEKLRADDHLLIFYAGHGYWDEQRRQGYWLPANAQQGRRADWISNSDLRDAIRAIPARHTLLVSDACFSGGIFVAREAFTRSAAIEELNRLPSRNAMTSGALTTVPDRSVFVQYLLKRLGENREPYLPASDLFSQLRTPVINNSPRQPDGSIPTPRYGVIQESGAGCRKESIGRRPWQSEVWESPMPGAFLICTGMFGSGARMIGTVATTGRRRMVGRGWIYPERARTASSAAAVGTTTPSTAGRRIAATTRQAAAASISVSAL